MKSFRVRLGLLSALIFGFIVAGFGLAGAMLFKKLFLESIDLQLAVPLDRVARQIHPHANFGRIFRDADIAYGKDIEDGTSLLMIRHDVEKSILYQKPANWIEAVDPALWNIKAEGRRPPDRSDGDGSPRSFDTRPEKGRGKGKGKGEPPGFVSSEPIEYFFIENEAGRWRVGVQRNRGFTVMMARNLSGLEEKMTKGLQMLCLAAPLCLILIGIGGWFVGYRAMKPLTAITDIASNITARELHERIPEKRGEYYEFANLISVLNRMMDRLEKGFTHAMRFTADVSHELKTPITIMQAEINTALKDCPHGSKEEKALQVISQESHRLKAITGSLMLLSQAESGRLVAKADAISLSEEVSDLAEDAEILCEKAELSLETDIEDGIEMITDQTLLHQALLNLVSNAVKYNKKGGWIKMTLSKHDLSGEAILRISNSGPGIPELDHDQIFERFFRVDKARDRSIDGFGLGLNLSAEIISVLGGELELIKADKEQTLFQVRIPL